MNKKTLIAPLLILSLVGCKSFEQSQMVPEKDPISPLLPTLEKTIEDFANSTVGTSQEELNFFTKEVEQNLIDPYGDKVGYIVLKRINSDIKLGLGWAIADGLLLGVPILFGAPVGTPQYQITYELRILDKNRKLIGKYENTGIGKAAIAMYWGYNSVGAARKALTDSWNDAFDEIRDEIQADSERLKAALAEE